MRLVHICMQFSRSCLLACMVALLCTSISAQQTVSGISAQQFLAQLQQGVADGNSTDGSHGVSTFHRNNVTVFLSSLKHSLLPTLRATCTS
jgi:hypothetical protein